MQVSDSALSEFISECEEILQRVSSHLQTLESGGDVAKPIAELYRDMHTLKGSAFLFGFTGIGSLAHAMEAGLEPMRRLKLAPSAGLVDSCFHSIDLITRIVKDLQAGRPESGFQSEVAHWIPRLADAASTQFGGEIELGRDIRPDFTEFRASASAPATAAAEEAKEEAIKVTAQAISQEAANKAAESNLPTPSHEEGKAEGAGPASAALADSSVRVQVALLDRLMNLVGELVLVRNQVLQYANTHEELEFLNLSKSLDVVTSDLQGDVMRTRMQPIGNVLTKFQRVVRDLARDLGKRMDITLQGTETELDKTLIEAIKDPLTHIIRNACDHGVETPEERKRAGKPENGHILVRAYHEGGQVVVEISDDGRGLDRNKLLQKAVEKGLVAQERAAKLSDREVYNLIFLPGFSTAKQVTSVSGRGVGMDVVKTNIEKIGGSVELLSNLGRGSTIRLKIPLTLAIVPAMLVKCAGQRFAIPQVKLVELVRIEGNSDGERVEVLQGRPVFRLRGNLLPLVDLKEVLGQKKAGGAAEYNSGANIVVLNAEGQIFGLIVDEILDTADIVVKPLSSFLNGLAIFSGATVMGDGSVALILDVVGIAEASHIDTKKGKSEDSAVEIGAARKVSASDAQEFLVFRIGNQASHAIPLCLVHRLEEFPVSAIEKSGDQWLVKYRDAILPLVVLDHFLQYDKAASLSYGTDRVSVVVIQRTNRSYGLVVKEIQDIVYVEEPIDDSVRDRPGVLGNMIQQNRIIVVVDALGVVETEVCRLRGLKPDSHEGRSALEELKDKNRQFYHKKVRVLFAEDVSFFRKQVAKLLTQEGFEVTVAEDGAAACKILESSEPDRFNLILSDIEMPKMNGFDLARSVRKMEKFKNIPMIALTTKFRQRDIDEGTAAGFNLYLEKLNPDKLLSGISAVMAEGGEKS